MSVFCAANFRETDISGKLGRRLPGKRPPARQCPLSALVPFLPAARGVTAAPPAAVRGTERPVPDVTPAPDAGLVCVFAHFSPDMPCLWSVITYKANN
jgi:hypothetical protein